MKEFAAFIRKEFLHIMRDRRTLLILLALPVAMILLFGFAISTEIRDVRTAVYAPSNDYLTRRIADRIDASEFFTVERIINDPSQINELLKEDKIDLAVVFEASFADQLMRTGHAAVGLVVDGSDPNTAAMMTGYARSLIAEVGREVATEEARDTAIPYLIEVMPRMLYNPQMKSAFNFVPGIMGLVLMLICAMMTSVSIVREKERGTMEVLLVSPVRPIWMILTKTVPYAVISMLNLGTILLLAIFLLQVPVSGSMFWTILVSAIFILSALAMGIVISSLVASQAAAVIISGIVLLVPTVMLTGMLFPIEGMPWPLRWFSMAIPGRWYVAAMRKLMIEGLPIRFALKELTILAGMTVALLALSLAKFKNRLQ